MAASKYDFSIEQGTSFQLSIVYKDANDNPVNLTGWCARLIWKTNTGSTQIFSTENIDYTQYKFSIDALNGQLVLLLPTSTTNNFLFNSAKYDLELSSPSELYVGGGNFTTKLLYGTVSITKRYSQANSILECS